jgi:uncharacterized protein (DUF2384 family)
MSDPSSPSTNRAETRSTSSERSTASFSTAELSTADRIQRTSVGQNSGGVLDRVKQSATTQLAQQKERGVDALGSVSQAVRSTTQRLRDEKHETIARYVDQAVDRIDTWTKQLKEKDVNELVTDVQRLARRQPALVIGSAFAVGLVAARFLKSSQQGTELAAGGGTYRSRYPGNVPMSTASDRSVAKTSGEAEVAFAAHEAAIPDVAAGGSFPGTSADARAGSRSSRGRKSNSSTETS